MPKFSKTVVTTMCQDGYCNQTTEVTEKQDSGKPQTKVTNESFYVHGNAKNREGFGYVPALYAAPSPCFCGLCGQCRYRRRLQGCPRALSCNMCGMCKQGMRGLCSLGGCRCGRCGF